MSDSIPKAVTAISIDEEQMEKLNAELVDLFPKNEAIQTAMVEGSNSYKHEESLVHDGFICDAELFADLGSDHIPAKLFLILFLVEPGGNDKQKREETYDLLLDLLVQSDPCKPIVYPRVLVDIIRTRYPDNDPSVDEITLTDFL
ncbi:unnamed protein product [Didymodactylos carnosus]|uniref:Uncharacterized protein n=1 Tax=Didymodactylos carnosus TaxID=1234261 RepID=A0A8S2DQR3_9BILA|nr:unnamed protein product [Didymodactylos carnosus]CAF3777232.1 unnamed protein product [Didymodactylos carnosus]